MLKATGYKQMKTSLDCIPCFLRQALGAARMVTSDETTLQQVMKKVLYSVSQFDMSLTPPEMGQIIHRIIREEVNSSDPYFEIKELSTLRALELSEQAKSVISKAESPFECAVRFSIAANIMDFGVQSTWDESHIMASFEKAEQMPIDVSTVEKLYLDISNAKKVLVLGDNAGEVVFDRLLIEQFPGDAEVIYAVKDSPVINDVTIYEATQSGIPAVARIISNGADIMGTAINQCSEEFIKEFNSADVVISKGQGNFETLNTNLRKIYFVLQVKCQVIADSYDYELGDWLVTTLDSMKEMEKLSCK